MFFIFFYLAAFTASSTWIYCGYKNEAQIIWYLPMSSSSIATSFVDKF